MAGYHWIAAYSWIDAFLDASMLLGGMGPVGELPNRRREALRRLFALYAGLVFLAITALMLAPVLSLGTAPLPLGMGAARDAVTRPLLPRVRVAPHDADDPAGSPRRPGAVSSTRTAASRR